MNCHSIVDTHLYIVLMLNLIQKTDIFGIQVGCDNSEGSEFVDLFAKSSVIINSDVPPNNYTKRAKRNSDQNKDGSVIFQADIGNINNKKINCIIFSI